VSRVYLLLHSNGDLRNSTVAGRLLMFATSGSFQWKTSTGLHPLVMRVHGVMLKWLSIKTFISNVEAEFLLLPTRSEISAQVTGLIH
jgi:hypothetical protein